MGTDSHRDDKTPLGEALEFAERWKGVHTDESYGPQGKIMGTLSRELLALHAQRSETRPTRFRLSGGYELWKNPAYPSDNKPWELLSETGAHIRYLDENEAQFVEGALSARAAVDTSAPCVARRAVEEIKAIIQKHVPLPGWAYEDEIVRVVRECERNGDK